VLDEFAIYFSCRFLFLFSHLSFSSFAEVKKITFARLLNMLFFNEINSSTHVPKEKSKQEEQANKRGRKLFYNKKCKIKTTPALGKTKQRSRTNKRVLGVKRGG